MPPGPSIQGISLRGQLRGISVYADVRRAQAGLDRLGRDQIPHATAQAINATLLQVQKGVRAHLKETFVVRREAFINRMVKIERGDFATKQKPTGRVGIQGLRSEILAKFERGGTKQSLTVGGKIAIPRVGSIVKPNRRSVVPDHLRPKELRDSLTFRTFVRPFKGRPGSTGLFAVNRVQEARLNARKKGGGKARASDVRRARPLLLYVLADKVPIPPQLHFEETAAAIIRAEFTPNMARALSAAIASAKGRR